jgi:nitrogen fixation protein FixH
MSAKGASANGLQGRHVLLALIGFFGVMLVVNAIFTYYAIATFGGGDTSKPYQKGLRYNETIAAAERQVDRGWQGAVSYSPQAKRLAVNLSDRSGGPVPGVGLMGFVGRPVTDKDDVRLHFREQTPGVYVAEARLAPGQWIVSAESLDLTASGQPLFRLKKRLLVEVGP